MGSPAVPPRTLLTLRLLQTSCGFLTVASLVALGGTTPPIVAHDGAATVASAHPAVPTAWSNGGPVAIPTIGVVPPGMEDWFDPGTAQTYGALPDDLTAPASRAPASSTEEPLASTAAETLAATTPAATTPAATTPAATTPAAPASSTAQRTESPATDTSPAAAGPVTTSPPSTTEPPHRVEEPPQTSPPTATNERGNVVLAYDDELTVFDGTTGAGVVAIAVRSVTSEVICTDPETAPAADGHLIAVQLRVTTGADLSAIGGEPAVRAADFRVRGPDGAPLTPAPETCLPDAESFPPGPMAAGQEFTGAVVLHVPAATGTLVFRPDFLTVGAEWEYGPPAAG